MCREAVECMTSCYLQSWASATRALQRVRTMQSHVFFVVRRLSWLWIRDAFCLPAVLTAWREARLQTKQQQRLQCLHARVQLQLLSLLIKRWTRVACLRRASRHVGSILQKHRRHNTFSAWLRLHLAHSTFVRPQSMRAVRLSFSFWQGEARAEAKLRGLLLETILIWLESIEAHRN